ncbi:MAG: bifunctional riboflavin kinase/FAD synthetase [Bacteroidota bacterium]|nr:bifunctional riboflavin kinase/FAD synthetase [Bacteroidota bacterium]
MEILNLDDIIFLPFPCVVTIGMFDGVHKGHKFMLQDLRQRAQNFGAKSVVVTFSNHPREVLDSKQEQNPIELIQSKQERYNKIAEQGVDYIFEVFFTKEFAKISPKEFLNILQKKTILKALVLGYDNSFGNPNNTEFKEIISEGKYLSTQIIQDKNTMYEQEIEISSSAIRKAIKNGNIVLANKMLEEEFSIYSNITKGYQIGRSLGFPTANIQIPTKKIVPKNGVYATRVLYKNRLYNSVTNIGTRPTFERKDRSIETFIFDFNEEIYNENIRLFFVDYLREERKFEDKSLLIGQMKIDIENAKKVLA